MLSFRTKIFVTYVLVFALIIALVFSFTSSMVSKIASKAMHDRAAPFCILGPRRGTDSLLQIELKY